MVRPRLKTMADKQARRLRRKLQRQPSKVKPEHNTLLTRAHSGPACLPQNDPRWLAALRG